MCVWGGAVAQMMTAALGRCWQNLSGASSKSHSVPISFTHSCAHTQKGDISVLDAHTHTFLLQIHIHTCTLSHTHACAHTCAHTHTHTTHPKITTPAKTHTVKVNSHPHPHTHVHTHTHTTHSHTYIGHLPVKMTSSPSARNLRVTPCPRSSGLVPFQHSSSRLPYESGVCEETKNIKHDSGKGIKTHKRLKRTLILIRQYTK